MHPKTTAAIAALEKSIQEACRLERRLKRLATYRPPVYWELDPVVLHTVTHVRFALQTSRKQLLDAPALQKNEHPHDPVVKPKNVPISQGKK